MFNVINRQFRKEKKDWITDEFLLFLIIDINLNNKTLFCQPNWQ